MRFDEPDLRQSLGEHWLGKRYRLAVQNTTAGSVEGVLDYDRQPSILPYRRAYALVLDGGYQIRLTPKDRLEMVR